ncbi:MAG: hypothetical protein KAR11_04705 [Phycisphaerae bacterium]|nr:hypothetical protein [Phycisphaerae bacterium]
MGIAKKENIQYPTRNIQFPSKEFRSFITSGVAGVILAAAGIQSGNAGGIIAVIARSAATRQSITSVILAFFAPGATGEDPGFLI